MKPSTVHSLITAKALYYESKPLIEAGNKYSSSAGLILLQDTIELILLALLTELGVDEQKNLDSKSVDELLWKLKKAGITIPKIGTINVQRGTWVEFRRFFFYWTKREPLCEPWGHPIILFLGVFFLIVYFFTLNYAKKLISGCLSALHMINYFIMCEPISKRPLLLPLRQSTLADFGGSGSNFNPRNTQCIPVVNPPEADRPPCLRATHRQACS